MGLLSLVFLAAAIVLQFFIVLSGGISSNPETKIYFLEADTSGMNARNPTRWTYWALCAVQNGLNSDCGKPVPALPFDPPHRTNFQSTTGVPDAFIGTRHYYYLSRFAWVFFLVALIFSVISFLLGGLALCTRIGAYFSSFNTSVALFFQALAASLMTAWTVQGRNAFLKAGHDAHLGKYAYGFTWGAVALLFLSMITFCMAGSGRKKDAYATETRTRRRRSFFRRRRSVRKEYV